MLSLLLQYCDVWVFVNVPYGQFVYENILVLFSIYLHIKYTIKLKVYFGQICNKRVD